MELTCGHCSKTFLVAEDNLVEEYVRRGELTREQAESHPRRSIMVATVCPSCGEPVSGSSGD